MKQGEKIENLLEENREVYEEICSKREELGDFKHAIQLNRDNFPNPRVSNFICMAFISRCFFLAMINLYLFCIVC